MSSHIHTGKSVQVPLSFLDNTVAQGLRSISRTNEPQLSQVTIDMLPDDALLEMFDFYLDNRDGIYRPQVVEKWHTLVHVCQRWRNLVFASPRHLDLQLLCTDRSRVREMLHIWPSLPIHIHSRDSTAPVDDGDNIIAALEYLDRVCHINVGNVPSPVLKSFAAVTQVPFPELRLLRLHSSNQSLPALPDSFLGGSAPRLQSLSLVGIPFPALRKLLWSATHLVHLELWDIPHSGYISPDAMVACLSELTELRLFNLKFRSPRSHPDQPSPPPRTRAVLPGLVSFSFEGVHEYLEDFVARIDTPTLHRLSFSFFLDLILDIPQLDQFIRRAELLKLHNEIQLKFFDDALQLCPREVFGRILSIQCQRVDWQVSSMARICSQLSPLLHHVQRLDLVEHVPGSKFKRKVDMESTQFLEFFQPFPTVRSLYVSKRLVSLVAAALRELTGTRATDVLPELRDIFLEGLQPSGSVQEIMQTFISIRQLSGHPVTVHRWEQRE